MKRLYFVRHGQTEWNAARRAQGQMNSDLNDLGRRQADANGRLLKDHGVQALFASPLGRTRQTTEIVQRHVPIEAMFDERIMEWDCGDWSGHTWDDVQAKWTEEWAALEADRFHYRGPGCENFPDMIARTKPFLADVLARPFDEIGIVSHGLIGRVMIGVLMNFSESEMLKYTQPNDVVYRVCVPRETSQPPQLDHFVGGEGPFPGAIAG